MRPIYLDNNATTAVDPAVLQAMLPWLTEHYGNPSSLYSIGVRAAEAIHAARAQVAALLACDPEEILFTSCGTESNNTALNSALLAAPDKKHLITTAVEHSAIIKHGETLARRGYSVTYLPVDTAGRLDPERLRSAIRPDTALVSIMWANNETGVTLPIPELSEIARQHRVPFHTDAVQAVGKIPIALRDLPGVTSLALAGHKLHTPKGIGALYISRRSRFHPYLIGGGQEDGRRGGTENVPYIVALGRASELAADTIAEESTRVRAMRDDFEDEILARIPGTHINGHRGPDRLPNTTSLRFDHAEGEALLMLLDQHQICCSTGSACTAGSVAPSHVLRAMGLTPAQARSSLRFSFSRLNTETEVDTVTALLPTLVNKLRSLRPPGDVIQQG